ncbi:MAG: hypothetical protein HXY30_04700 [Pseudorhodoplanes sp.]|nr:hypothetical protein [Pseudorhodoplanes sp.]
MALLDPIFSEAIAGIESGGRYDALGPATKSGEYLRNPEAQEAVFRGQFGIYVQKYGPDGAARACFADEKGMNNLGAKDVLGRIRRRCTPHRATRAAGSPQRPRSARK